MEAANAAAPGTHSKEEIAAENLKLRELMCRWSKRSLVRPSQQGKETKDVFSASDDALMGLRRALWEKERELQVMLSEERACAEGEGEGEQGGDEADGAGAVGGTYSRAVIDACEEKVRALRDKVLAARRRALMAELRAKVKEMKDANKTGSGTYPNEQIAVAMTRLRSLMSRDWVKEMPPDNEQEPSREAQMIMAGLSKAEQREMRREQKRREKLELRESQRAAAIAAKDAAKAAQEAQKLAMAGIGAQPSMLFQDGWRRCNCPKDKCGCPKASSLYDIYQYQRMAQQHQYMQTYGAMTAAEKTPAHKTPRRGRAAPSQHPWPLVLPPNAAATHAAAQPAHQPPPPASLPMGYSRHPHPSIFAHPYYTPAPPQKRARKRAKSTAPELAMASAAAAWASHYGAWGMYAPPTSAMRATPARAVAPATHGHILHPYFPVSVVPPTLTEICRDREIEGTLYYKAKETSKASAGGDDEGSWNGNMGDASGQAVLEGGRGAGPAAPPPPNEAGDVDDTAGDAVALSPPEATLHSQFVSQSAPDTAVSGKGRERGDEAAVAGRVGEEEAAAARLEDSYEAGGVEMVGGGGGGGRMGEGMGSTLMPTPHLVGAAAVSDGAVIIATPQPSCSTPILAAPPALTGGGEAGEGE